ncbi:hypothetical protein BH10BAC4_BH10BAC4_07600 [soil metagenome]
MQEDSLELDQVRKELAYYKAQVDQLAGNTMKDQYGLAQLSYDHSQLMKGFQIIADIQRSFNAFTSPDALYRSVLDAILSNMSTDKVVMLMPDYAKMNLKPNLWRGYSQEESSVFAAVEIPISMAFSKEKKSHLVNSQIEPTKFEKQLQQLLGAPYFVFTPLHNDGKLWAALFAGRNYENRLLSTKSYSQSSVDTFESIAGMISSFTQQLEQNKLMEKERIRIARDMHDDVGSELSKISIACENIKKQYPSDLELRNHLSNVQTAAGKLVDNIGNIIWALNPINNNTISLIGYLREYAYDYLEMNQLALDFDAPELSVDHPIRHEARTHIFMVIKEALHNIVKYADATKVNINVILKDNSISCEVSDNGKGFSKTDQRNFGNGLRNMQQRISETGGAFSITSAYGKGTRVSLEVPI